MLRSSKRQSICLLTWVSCLRRCSTTSVRCYNTTISHCGNPHVFRCQSQSLSIYVLCASVPAEPSTDRQPPTCAVNSIIPIENGGGRQLVRGVAQDFGGGIVAAVEISEDGGLRWHPADAGTTMWYVMWLRCTTLCCIHFRFCLFQVVACRIYIVPPAHREYISSPGQLDYPAQPMATVICRAVDDSGNMQQAVR